ncbi:right-handed parallel beta-helix repeat-containing protein [Halorubrum sp. HHNYT27]|uniref:right-handed parallel beta-helix repeat-containing protein n=1 Tax=Halorubrum sp. HHNYT27 TaxID=3402275 RepID=UPI003EBB89ED
MDRSDSEISRRNALRKGGIAIAGSVVGLSSASTTAVAEPTEIAECGEYRAGEYVLTEDISTTGGCLSLEGDVTLDGNGHTISGDGTGVGISMGEGTVEITNLNLDDFGTGIRISTLGTIYEAELTVRDTIISNTSAAISGNYRPRITLQDSELRDNGTGISGGEAARVSIRQSTISGHDGQAVFTDLGNFIGVENSVIEDNGAGIDVGQGTITDSTIADNDGYGIKLIGLVAPADVGETTLVGNDIQNNSGAGILFKASNGTVRENTIADNQNGVVISYDYSFGGFPDRYEFINNNIENNAEFGIHNRIDEFPTVDLEDTGVPDATCNYWGDPTGPQNENNPNENPQGDRVSDNVEFGPWSVTEIQDGEGTCLGGNPIGDFQSQPTDPDGDGLYEDINGDGESDIVDVQALFSNSDDETVQNNPDAFDFNDDGSVDVVDVQKLFTELSE